VNSSNVVVVKCSVFWVLFEMRWTIWMSNVVIGARCNDCRISWSNETSVKTAFPCFTRLLFVLDLPCDFQCFCLETVHTLHNNQVSRQSCVKMNNVFGDHCDSRKHLRSQHAKAKVWTSFLQLFAADPSFLFCFCSPNLQTGKGKRKNKHVLKHISFCFFFFPCDNPRQECMQQKVSWTPWCHHWPLMSCDCICSFHWQHNFFKNVAQTSKIMQKH